MVYVVFIVLAMWLSGPIQQGVEKHIDTNDLVLAYTSLRELSQAVSMVGNGGAGERTDFVVHIPWNTVDIWYDKDKSTVTLAVILYRDLPSTPASNYRVVRDDGRPFWYDKANSVSTPFFYMNITEHLSFPLDPHYFPFCSVKKDSTIVRGQSTTFLDSEGNPIKFCCESGFNLHMYARKSPANLTEVAIKPRYYYSLPGVWNIVV